MARGGMGAIFLAAAGEPGFQKLCVIKKVIAEKSRSGQGQSLPRRGQGGAAPVARQPGPHLRRRRGRRRVLHRHGAGRGEGPARDLEPLRPHAHAHPARRRAARGARDRPRALLRPQLRRPAPGPPRRRAAQHPAQLLRRGEADRLRPGAQRAQAGEHGARRGVRSRVVPVARAGARRDRRRAHRHLQPGDRAVGAGDRATSTCSWPTSIRRPRCRWCATRAPQPPSAKAPWITPNLDALADAGAGPRSRAAVPVGRGDAPGAVGRSSRRSRRAPTPSGPPTSCAASTTTIMPRRSGPSATRCWPRARRCSPAPPRRKRRSARMPVAAVARSSPASTKLAFPKEDESLGVDFTGRVDRQPLPGDRARSARAGWGPSTPASTSRSARAWRSRSCTPPTRRSRIWSSASGARRAPPRASATRTSSTSPTSATTEDGCAYFVMEHLDGHRSRRRAVARAAARPPTRACRSRTQICRALARRARGRRHPPRSQAGEHLPGRARRPGRLRQGARLRHRPQHGAGRAASPTRAWRWGRPSTWRPSRREGGAVDQRSDIYSVGALLYEMTSGSPPADVARQGADPAARDQGRRARGAGPDHRARARARIRRTATRRMAAARVRPGEVAVRALARRRGDAGPARSGARRRAGGLLLRRGPGGRHPRADSPLATPRRAPSPVPPPAGRREPGGRGATTRGRRRAASPPPPVAGPAPRCRVAGGDTRGRSWCWRWLAVAAMTIYRRLPWSARAQPAAAAPPPVPAPTVAERRRARGPSASAPGWPTSSGCWAAPFDFAELPALRERLGRLRADGGAAIADTLATRAKGLLVKSAEAELDRGEIEAGVAHYRMALALDRARAAGRPSWRRRCARARSRRCRRTRTPRRCAGRARRSRWPTADPEAHALLADVPARAARGRRGGHRVREGAGGAPRRSDLHPRPVAARHALAAETAAASTSMPRTGAARRRPLRRSRRPPKLPRRRTSRSRAVTAARRRQASRAARPSAQGRRQRRQAGAVSAGRAGSRPAAVAASPARDRLRS